MTGQESTDDAPKDIIPVKEGEQYKVKIEGLGRQGDGIAKVQGFVVFVPDVKVGDELDIRIRKVAKRNAFGEKI